MSVEGGPADNDNDPKVGAVIRWLTEWFGRFFHANDNDYYNPHDNFPSDSNPED